MKGLLLSLLIAFTALSGIARAQEKAPPEAPVPAAGEPLSPAPEPPGMQDQPFVRLQSLDKSSARTVTFEARVGSTLKFGPLFIKIQACRKSQPLEAPESAAFLQIWELPPGKTESQWVFSGWMFASSPALSAMDHPVYDVWVIECLEALPDPKVKAEEEKEEADPATAPDIVPDAAEEDRSYDTEAPSETEPDVPSPPGE